MRTKLLLFGLVTVQLFLCFFNANAQVQTARYETMIPNAKGFYEYLPQNYSASPTERFPLILFIHGLGETGAATTTSLPNVLRNGIPRVINEGKFPVSFTVNGVTSKFIVISPQFNGWPSITDVDGVLDYIEAHYKVDPKRIYVTGLSMGGGATWDYGGCSSNLKYVQRIAGIVPVCGASSPSAYRARTIAKYNLPVWALHNLNDPTVASSGTVSYINQINAAPAPNPMAKMTIFNASGHDAWSKAYDPNYKENNMNVYEWMLQYSRGGATPPANTIPVANAGADKAITLPVNSLALAGLGTDANGTIASYAWTRTGGPTQSTFSNAAVANPTVSNLVAGTYTFRLTVTDNQGATAYDDVVITVNAAPAANVAPVANAGTDKAATLPANTATLSGSGTDSDGTIATYAWTKTAGPTQYTISSTTVASPSLSNLVAGTYSFRLTVTDNKGATASDDVNVVITAAPPVSYLAIPGKIEAESYAQMSGIQTETTTDAGAGLNVGYVEANDWLDYNVSVATAGNYDLTFRVAATAANNQIQLKKADGTILTTVVVPNTGGWQAFTTVSTVVALTAGNQVLRVTTTTGGWNLNWFQFANTVVTPPATGPKAIKVKIFGGTNPYNNAEWNNWNISSASSLLKYSDGTASTAKVSFNIPGSVADNGTAYVSGIAPAEVLRHSSYSTVQRTLTISGLSPSKTYDIELYASRSNNPGNSTVFATSGSSQTVLTYNNSTQKAVFTGKTANASGQIIVTVSRLNTYNYLNGFVITENDGAALRVASSESLAEIVETAGQESIGVYPNPFQDQVVLQLKNSYTGNMTVFLLDVAGKVRGEYKFNKTQSSFNNTILLGKLPAGVYILKIQVGGWSATKKIIKN